jgi:hypothetical protein
VGASVGASVTGGAAVSGSAGLGAPHPAMLSSSAAHSNKHIKTLFLPIIFLPFPVDF